MSDITTVINKISNLERYIEDALNNEVAEVIKKIVAETAREKVYAYTPMFVSRRGDDGGDFYDRTTGGITDPNSIYVHATGSRLVAYDISEWQQLWNGSRPESRLAEAIATGDPRFHMANAGPRPYHAAAKEAILRSGKVEEALRRGLARQGVDTSGITFTFE